MRKLIIFLLLLIAASAKAATTPNSVVLPQMANRGIVQFLQGTDSAGTYKTLYTATTTGGSICFSMWTSNSDASATHPLTIQLVSSGVKYGGTALTPAVSSGFATGAPAVAITTPSVWPGLLTDIVGNEYIILADGDTIQATFTNALTTSTLINIEVSCVDY